MVEQAIREADAGFEGAHLVIVSYNRVVLLLGQVASDELKKQAGEVTAALLECGGCITKSMWRTHFLCGP